MPIYPSTYKLSQTAIRQAVENSLKMVGSKIEETLPDYLLSEYHLEGLETSLQKIHFPNSDGERLQARKRLVFEELLSMQLALLELKEQTKVEEGICYSKRCKMSDVINQLSFKLTKAQLKEY